MPATATSTHTTRNTTRKGLGRVLSTKKAVSKKKETIEELGEKAQKIAKKYNMKPFERKLAKPTLTPKEEEFKKMLMQGLKELDDYRNGKIEFQDLDDFLNEI